MVTAAEVHLLRHRGRPLYCRLPYSVGADGLYRIGPGPEGQLLSGKLPSDEFAEIEKAYLESASTANSHSGDSACVTASSDTDDTVTYVPRIGDSKEWLKTTSKSQCIRLASAEAAQKLLQLLRRSAQLHYPIPFPDDACDGANASLESLYGFVRKCEKPSDCVFFDDSFQPIASDVSTFLITGDCSGAHPLLVGNRERVGLKREALLGEIAHARNACKNRAATACTGFSDFLPTQPAPICSAGFCQPVSE